jgi:hypothetical protein
MESTLANLRTQLENIPRISSIEAKHGNLPNVRFVLIV